MTTTIDSKDRQAIRAALLGFVDLGGPDFLAEMVNLLKTQIPKQIRKIEEELAANNLDQARIEAHSMKSSFGNYGATECQHLAAAMESAGKEGSPDEFRAQFQRLRAAFDRLLLALDEFTIP
jgi:HPt (histidine-containing phosphotransfer) domain-containing protein